jgi:uncharacterized protein (DUF1800 family)
MMRFVAALLLLASGAAFAGSEASLTYEEARHLLNRTGFGASDADIRAYARLTRIEAVDKLLAETKREPTLAPPAFVDAPFVPYYKLRELNAEDRMAELRTRLQQGFELRAWWLHEMVLTSSPLTERMTLFWHNHFATSQQKVRSVTLMYRQNALLRRESLGNFGRLLHEIARDPAMLVYLDNAGSRRQAPNENFAREVMELFTLGEGHYSERDVKESARAFTGFSLDRDTGQYVFRRMFHDGGEKTVLGRTGRLDGDEVLDILLAQPQAAEFVTTKLWREFVSPTPEAAEVRRLAELFRATHYEVKPLMRALLVSDAFWAAGNRAVIIKSPVDLVVGSLRTFEIRPMDFRPAAFAVALLGQNLFQPPNVKGWPGGEKWIDASTLLGRRQWTERIFRGAEPAMRQVATKAEEGMATPKTQADRFRREMERGMGGYAFDADRFSRAVDVGLHDRGARLSSLVLPMAPANPVPVATDDVAYLRALAADPVFQLR